MIKCLILQNTYPFRAKAIVGFIDTLGFFSSISNATFLDFLSPPRRHISRVAQGRHGRLLGLLRGIGRFPHPRLFDVDHAASLLLPQRAAGASSRAPSQRSGFAPGGRADARLAFRRPSQGSRGGIR